MKREKLEVIKCPRCGIEYLPAEIYIPKYFVGTPKNIVKVDGKIDWYSGLSMDTKESYCCDKCGCNFNVVARVTFQTTTNEKHDFNKVHKTSLKPNKLFFDEG